MKIDGKLVVVIAVVIIAIVLVFAINGGKKTNDENEVQQGAETGTTQEEGAINITEKKLKDSVEKKQDGVVVSNVKLLSNANNIVNVMLNVKNENSDERIVNLSVVYYNANKEEIGRNGYSVGIMQKDENKDLESTCYIGETDVASVELELNVEEVPEPTPSTEGSTDNASGTTPTED